MDNSERIKKWKEERARVADEARAARIAKKHDERTVSERDNASESPPMDNSHSNNHSNSPDWPATDAESVRRASLMIKARRVKHAQQSLRNLLRYVGLPLLVMMVVSWLMTSRFYRADATFVVQSDASQQTVSGPAFFGSGNQMAEGFRVREFILSKEMMDLMEKELGFLSYFAQDDMALLSRYDTPLGVNGSPYRYYLSKVSVSADIQQGMLRLTVQALDAEKAEFFAQRMLAFAEQHVNEVSARMQQERLSWLENDVKDAQAHLAGVRQALLNIQHIQKDIEPQETVTAIYQLIAGFETQLAEATSERDQLMANGLDKNPMVPRLAAKISVLKKQIIEQRDRLSTKLGSQGSLDSLGVFDDIRLQAEMAKTRWEVALQTLQQGKLQALRERRYLLVISQPMVVSDTQSYDAGATWFMVFILLGLGYFIIALLLTLRRLRE
ncbi:sugar transporter [Budvicia aquatica]|uniref:Sugar transporter n=1 Tax=Budvicia aquatica TaxID=82979 RepID=A0A2C6DIV2_9GAMM|nr:sugar transporter [Budvicia aquatica]PHI28252.1 sugar transporter [Budvicia aquatica]VFS46130.1 Vi polysaccharide export inner membrane protein VexD [Budvicia aquatica]